VAGDEGHLEPHWAQVRPYRGVGPAPWRVLDEETLSGEVEAQMRAVEGDGEDGIEGRRGRVVHLGPPVWRRPPLQ